MARGPEGKLQDDCMTWLKEHLPKGYSLHWKIADRYTSGILDIVCIFLCRHGATVTYLIELKRPGEKPNALQQRNIDTANAIGKASRGGVVRSAWVDNFDDFKNLFWDLL